MLKLLHVLLPVAAGITGLVAAGLWFWATSVQPAPGPIGYVNPQTIQTVLAALFEKWRKASNLNKWAAGVTGLSVLLSSISQFLPN
jgi:hypothetical protein